MTSRNSTETLLLFAIVVGVWLNLLINATPTPARAAAYQDVNIVGVGGYTVSPGGVPVLLPPQVKVDLVAINSYPFSPYDVNRFSVALPVKAKQ